MPTPVIHSLAWEVRGTRMGRLVTSVLSSNITQDFSPREAIWPFLFQYFPSQASCVLFFWGQVAELHCTCLSPSTSTGYSCFLCYKKIFLRKKTTIFCLSFWICLSIPCFWLLVFLCLSPQPSTLSPLSLFKVPIYYKKSENTRKIMFIWTF